MESNIMTQEKTKNQILMTGKNKVYAILIFIGALFFSIAPFLHINMPKQHIEIKNLKKEINKQEKIFDNTILEKRLLLKNNQISSLEFLNITDEITKNKTLYIQKSNSELKNLINSKRVFGFKTLRTFTIGFFVRLPYLLFSFIILILSFNLKKVKYLSKALNFLIFNFFFISFYHLVWFLWDSNDLPKSTYYIAIAIISIIFSFSFINLIKYFNNKDSIFKEKIRSLVSFITFSRENIVKELALKAILNNVKDDKINSLIDKHEDEMWKTLEKTAE